MTQHRTDPCPRERAEPCPRSDLAWSLLAPCLFLGLLLAAPAARAQDDSLSAPLSGSVGDPIYSESNLTGPSGSLVPGDTNLLTPYIRTGISDPLDFLIESGYMSPYDFSSYALEAYVGDAYVATQVVNDSTVAARFSEYRDNRLQMAGAGGSSTPGGRAMAAGGSTTGSQGAKMAGAASEGFGGGLSARAPFAAGSSVLAARQAALSGMNTFEDPNQLVAAATSSAALSQMQGDVSGGGGAAASASAGAGNSSGPGAAPNWFDTTAGVSYAAYASVPAGMLVPAPDSTAAGPGPGDIFPDVSMAMVSGTGFEDSTMGTAGLPMQQERSGTSPLASPYADSEAGPFKPMSSEGTEFLTPTLMVGADQDQQEAPVSLSELTRKLRMHAMIYNPGGSPLPSPFQQRALQKEYLSKKSQHHVSRYPALTAPSITP